MSATSIHAIPIQTSATSTVGGGGGGGVGVKYPINIACECIFTLYVDGVYVGEGNKENYDPVNWPFGISEWNDTKKYYPVIYDNEPKIVAFNGMGSQYTVFPNGFIMDMNDGKDYTKYKEWRCKDFSKTDEKSPPTNWFTYDYDDNGWDISASYGANYQNNSFQMFESPRYFISLDAEWLWTKDNSDANIYCRKKNINTVKNVDATTMRTPTTVMPTLVPTTSTPSVTTMVRPIVLTTTTAVPPLVSTTIHHTPVRTHPHTTATPTHVSTTAVRTIVSTTAVPTHVTTTIHHSPVRTHPHTTAAPTHVTTTAVPTTAVPTTVPPLVSTTIHHSPVRTHVPTTAAPTQVMPTTATTPSIRINIIINNIKYSRGISDKQLSKLLDNVKYYNSENRRSEYDTRNLYRTVINARIALMRHYETLLRHIEQARNTNDNNDSDPDPDTIPRRHSLEKTDKSAIVQSMIKLNSRIKHIEDSVHFIKGNHKYLLLRILRNLKKQYKKDTMDIFNI
jgi:hypothetical protein